MRLNILINPNESINKGPGRRAKNLLIGLDRLSIPYEICSDNFDFTIGMQASCVFNRIDLLPAYTPIGPNVIHEPAANIDIANRFTNFIVQSAWVEDYWRWTDATITDHYNFFIYPASVDMDEWSIFSQRSASVQCLFYTKYQSTENKNIAQKIYADRNHSSMIIEYGKYTTDDLKDACLKSEYCIFNSCCEKSSNALLEILATGLPVYVVNSHKWIGDDKFDRATSAPDFDERCGIIGGYCGENFDEFYDNVKMKKYDPVSFVKENYTVEKISQKVVDIAEECYSCR